LTDVTVRRLGPDDWRTYRDVRLAMLQESPEAFGSRYADAVGFDEETWRGRLTTCEHHFAELDGRPVGSAGLWSQDGEAHLIGMWVDPAFRGRSVGALLVAAVLERAAATGHDRVGLDVVDSNVAARRLYERMGFVATGVVQEHPNTPGATEFRMVRLL
jgi:ribosomal protein S18 acetylase RimI-like enzyme